jgi:hypothetical protein
MNTIQHLVIAIGVLVILLAAIGVSVASLLKGGALPKWARFNPNDSWGFMWIDKKRWLKLILIRILQGAILITIFFVGAVGVVTKALFKFASSAAKAKK